MSRNIIFIFLITSFQFFVFNTKAQLPVLLNESFEEWSNIEAIATAEGSSTTIIKATNSAQQLFLYLEIDEVISMQSVAKVLLYIDTDNDTNTGIAANGIGAEIKVDFGNRTVFVGLNGKVLTVGFNDIELNLMPTVWSNKFEMAINRDASINGVPLFSSDVIRIIVEDKNSNSFSPSNSGGALYSFEEFSFDPLPTYSIEKTELNHLRVMSHNVLFDNLFNDESKSSFERMYKVISPSLIGFQEIYDHSPEELIAIMEEMLPSAEGEAWYSAKVKDCMVASRFPVKFHQSIHSSGNGAFLLNLRPTYDTDLLLISAHTPCCDNDDGRASEIDAIMAFVREAKGGDEYIKLQANTPIIMLGDMNLVGNPQDTQTLLDGDIQDENKWGEDFIPDWNNDDFIDVQPIVSGLPMTFTHWSNIGSGQYSSGRLDPIIYSGSGLILENSFVLNTPSLSNEQLLQFNLQSDDSKLASDHLPVVADFTVTAQTEDIVSLLDLRLNNGNGVSVYNGTTVSVTGIVSTSKQFGDDKVYFQNNEAGISIYGANVGSALIEGDSIEISAEVTQFNGLTQLVYIEGETSVNVLKNTNSPNPISSTISSINNQIWNGYELLEGRLVKLYGVEFKEEGVFNGKTNYQISDASGSLVLRIDENTDLLGSVIPEGKISITGIVVQYDLDAPYDEGYQILPRSIDDIQNASQGILSLRENNAIGRPVLEGELISATGVVTANSFGFNGPAFFQDEVAGVALWGSELVTGLKVGDSITVSSNVGFYNALTEYTFDASSTNVTIHKPDAKIPDAKIVTINEILNQNWNSLELLEGSLVEIQDVEFNEVGKFTLNTPYTISDGFKQFTVFIDDGTNISGLDIPENKGNIRGIIFQYDKDEPYSEGYILYPRSTNDFDFTNSNTSLVNIKGHELLLYPNPVTNQLNIQINSDDELVAVIISDLEGKELINYSSFATKPLHSMPINSLKNGIYICNVVLKDTVLVKKLLVKRE